MKDNQAFGTAKTRQIRVEKNGPYHVTGDVPLVRKIQVVSEFGEPLTWRKEGELAVNGEKYRLCRCGQSRHLPFCDGTHQTVGFDGTEQAPTDSTSERSFELPGGTHIVVSKDPTLCNLSGFCGMRSEGIFDLVPRTADTEVRSLVIAMVERCPSGSLTWRLEPESPDIEPDLPAQIALVTEITSDGPITGPLWVTGGIPVERSDGEPFENRNRVTLCTCGRSSSKPLCDGTHRPMDHSAARRRRAGGRL